jgi:O-antigen/teichoic acid export membrane protein
MLVFGGSKALAVWLIARFLGPVVQGSFALALGGMVFGATLLSGGLEYSNSFAVGRRPEGAEGVVRNTFLVFLLGLLLAPVLALGFGLAFPQTYWGFEGRPAVGWLLLGLATALYALVQNLKAVALGSQRFRLVAGVQAVWGISWLLLALAAIRAGYPAILGSWTAALFAAVLIFSLGLGIPRSLKPDPTLLKLQLSYGARTLAGSVARNLNMRLALYLVALFLAPADVGVFAVLLTVAETYLYLPNALSQVTIGVVSARRGHAQEHRQVMLLVAGVGVLAILAAAWRGRWFLDTVFGTAYGVGAPALTILLAGTTFHAIGLLRLHRLLGEGRAWAATLAQVVGMVATIVAGLLLTPRWGLVGAAGTMCCTYAIFAGFLLMYPGAGTDAAMSEEA